MVTKILPSISIIVLNYNGLKYLKETLPAIETINYPSFEIIVVDNGSSDGSVEFLKKNIKIKFIQSPKISEKNYACNLGVSYASGEFILLMDNDLLITDRCLLSELVSEWKSLETCGSISLAFSDRGSELTKGYGCYTSYYYSWEKPEINNTQLLNMHRSYVGSPNGAGIFIKKELWDEIGGYDDHLSFGGDDDDLGMRLWMSGYKNYLYAKSIQIHIGQEERTNIDKYSKKLEKKVYAHLYTTIKNFNFLNALLTIAGYSLFSFAKSVKQSFDRRNIQPFLSTLKGYYLFLKNLKFALNKRKKIKKMRKIKKDIIFNIRPIL